MSSLAVSALPRCVALRSTHDKSYLRSVHDESHGGSLMELGHGDGGLMNPRARFYLEPSLEHEGLIHVRCCYNNKYWMPQQRVLPGHGGSALWVIGTTDEPEEDLSKPSCTLHQLISITGDQAEEDGSTTCRFLHSKLGKYACTVSSMSVRSHMHIASHEDEADHQDGGGLIHAFTLIDVSQQKQLPKYVAFKGDNDLFLQLLVKMPYAYDRLKFEGDDIGNERALHTVSTNDDGVVWILSNYNNYFWKGPGWIVVNTTGGVWAYGSTTFRVITGDDFVALQNRSNNCFCKRLYSEEDGGDCLAAPDDSVSITERAKLKVLEPVISRQIYDVDFRLNEARTYTTGIGGLHSQTIKNNTSTINKSTLTFTYTTTETTTWSATVSLKAGIKTTLVTKVPFFAEASIEVGYEFSGSYDWGKTETKEEQVSKHIEVEVPPMKKVTVKAIGSNGVCDIPFSYTQRDILINGQEVIQKFHDGLYVGVKTSNITFETTEEDL